MSSDSQQHLNNSPNNSQSEVDSQSLLASENLTSWSSDFDIAKLWIENDVQIDEESCKVISTSAKQQMSIDQIDNINRQRDPRAIFDNSFFTRSVLGRIIEKKKVCYYDNCILHQLNKEFHALAHSNMNVARPRTFSDIKEIKKFSGKYGNLINYMDLGFCWEKLTEDNLRSVPQLFKNVKVIELGAEDLEHTARHWVNCKTIKYLMNITTDMNAILFLNYTFTIYENEGIANWWEENLTTFLTHLKKFWKGVVFTFKIFSLDTATRILSTISQFEEEGVFSVRVALLARSQYLFAQTAVEEQISPEKYEEVLDFLKSTPLLTSLVLKCNLFDAKTMEDERLLKLIKTLEQAAPTGCDILHYSASQFGWTQNRTNQYRLFGEPIRNDPFGSKIILYGPNKHKDHARPQELLQEYFTSRLDAMFLETSLKHCKWLLERCSWQFHRLRHLEISLEYGDTTKLITDVQSFGKLENLQILAIFCQDYQMTSDLLQQLVNIFEKSFPTLEGFYFQQWFTSKLQKEGSSICFPFLSRMRNVKYIKINAPFWKLDEERFFRSVKDLPYLWGLIVVANTQPYSVLDLDANTKKYLMHIKNQQLEYSFRHRISHLREVRFPLAKV
eukprot:TRINITY_DN1973_c0_g1_i9.p1 TRINITY_DN1973_c0_g1~~TRINITY_DN1973_c0_g1_i9.p1  ORF type:complete len:616 (+),score=27.46 TRINITY_DN1973_c0_g1_i9:176-2023(+)